MSINKPVLLLLCLAMVTGCRPRKSEKAPENMLETVKSSLSGNFTISGAYALYPLVQKWADDFSQNHPGVKITVIETGTGQGISDLINGKVSLAMISRPLNDDEKESGIWVIPVAKDGVAPIVNQNNPYLTKLMEQGLSPDEMQRIFLADKSMMWGEVLDTPSNENINVYARADESGAADIFAGFFYKKASDLKGKKVTGDFEMIKSIQDDRLAIGFCNFSYAYDLITGAKKEKIQVIPFDLDFDNKINRKEDPFINLETAHRSIWLGVYPESLCRELTIGSLGKPTDPAIVEFLRYILTEGQSRVKETGMCELNNAYIKFSLGDLQ
jgi:phosphate transport system substrate-binding protein